MSHEQQSMDKCEKTDRCERPVEIRDAFLRLQRGIDGLFDLLEECRGEDSDQDEKENELVRSNVSSVMMDSAGSLNYLNTRVLAFLEEIREILF